MLAVQRDDFVRAVYAALDRRAAEYAERIVAGGLRPEDYIGMTRLRLGLSEARQIVADVLKGFERDEG